MQGQGEKDVQYYHNEDILVVLNPTHKLPLKCGGTLLPQCAGMRHSSSKHVQGKKWKGSHVGRYPDQRRPGIPWLNVVIHKRQTTMIWYV